MEAVLHHTYSLLLRILYVIRTRRIFSIITWEQLSNCREEIDQVMAMTNYDLGLVFDTGHLIYAGADPLELKTAQIGTFTVVGTGIVPATNLKNTINIRYDGCYSSCWR